MYLLLHLACSTAGDGELRARLGAEHPMSRTAMGLIGGDGYSLLTKAWTGTANQPLSRYGSAVAAAGDVNADGFDDFIVGSYLYSNDQTTEGQAYLYLGAAEALDTQPAWVVEGDQDGAQLGASLAPAGDVDADGFDDVIVGVPSYDGALVNQGAAFVYRGGPDGLEPTPAWVLEPQPGDVNDYFGSGVAGGLDVNGDGFDDVLVRASGDDDGGTDAGRISLHFGSPQGPSATADWSIVGDDAADLPLGEVAPAGDVNADGYDDIIVGAFDTNLASTGAGAVYLYLGAPLGPNATAAWVVESDQAHELLGASVASAGDVDGDGYDDVVLGAPNYDGALNLQGRAELYRGSATGLEPDPSWTKEGGEFAARFGDPIVGVGDVDNDGYDDVVVGLPLLWSGAVQGEVYLYRGSPSGLEVDHAWGIQGLNLGELGYAVAGVGDVDGTGGADVLVSAPFTDPALTGRAFVYLGCGGPDDDGDGVANPCDACPGLDDAVFNTDLDPVCAVDPDGAPLDCDDADGTVYPGAAELCDGKDNACAGSIPADEVDGDLDGSIACAECDDTDPTRHPGAVELCNGVDDVCAGALPTDETDVDSDGFIGCAECDDIDPTTFPGAPERCDGRDNACAGTLPADEVDADADGFVACEDCDDADPETYPGAPEKCDGLDNRCGGSVLPDEIDLDGDGRSECQGDVDDADPIFEQSGRIGSGAEGGWFGRSVAGAGDVNGDGHDDLIVGAPLTNGGWGSARVFHGSTAGLDPSAGWTALGTVPGASFGWSVASAGDVNGDSYADVIVGTFGLEEGRADVYLGARSGLGPDPVWTSSSPQAGAQYGAAVAGAGDLNGDGLADVVVGAGGAGTVSVYLGAVGGVDGQPVLGGTPDLADANYGGSVASAGDVDGDGYADLLVGSPLHDGGEPDEGLASLLRGSAVGLDGSASWSAEPDSVGAGFGAALAPAGDLDGDGFDDVVIGAGGYSGALASQGAAFVYAGSPAGLGGAPVWQAVGDRALAELGGSVASAGDVDGDGFGDLLLGARGFDGGETGEGAAWLYRGGSDGPALAPAWQEEPHQEGASFGVSVAAAGDLDGDGRSDLVVGAHLYDGATVDEGAAFVYLAIGACDAGPDEDADGYLACADCDDRDATTHPGAPERCDGRDNACTGAIPADEAPGPDGAPLCAPEPPPVDEACGCDARSGGPSPGYAAWLALAALLRRRRGRGESAGLQDRTV